MKFAPILPLVLALFLTGCGSEPTASSSIVDNANQMTTVEDLMEQATQEEAPVTSLAPEITPSVEPETQVSADIPEGFGSYESVDIDLTTLNSVMVYSQVYDMMCYPENYLGQTVKMHGSFGYYYEESVDTYYFGIIVRDATACCAQGIEFTLTDEDQRTFPDDYPEALTDATVVGIFSMYYPEESPDWAYYRLEQAEFITE